MFHVLILIRRIVYSFQKIKIVEGIKGNDERFAGFWLSKSNKNDRGIEILFGNSVSIFIFSMRTRQTYDRAGVTWIPDNGYDNISLEVDGEEKIQTGDFRQVLH